MSSGRYGAPIATILLNLRAIGYTARQMTARSSEASLDTNRSNLWLLIAAVAHFIGGSICAFAQQGSPQPSGKWRPKDGVYMTPGKNFDQQCQEFGNLRILLKRKEIGGIESTCKIAKLTDTVPGAIRLDLVSDDVDTVEDVDSNPDPKKRTQKEVVTQRREVMTLRKVDDKTLLSNATQNGKFEGPEERSTYCPEKWQRSFFETVAQQDKEAKQEASKSKER